jgi:hypothetical protein
VGRVNSVVREILIDHLMAIEERNLLRTETSWPDLSDIYVETERKLAEAIGGPLAEDLACHIEEEKRLRQFIWEWGLRGEAGSPRRTAAARVLYGSSGEEGNLK